PLSHFLATKQFQVRQAVVLVGRIAKALRHAHLQGVLHRDLKPANILINQEGKPIVTDFGLACFYDSSVRSRMTTEGKFVETDGDFVGTPAYVSPEQARGNLQQIGPPADVYSLGVILYEMLTGQLPYIGTPMAIIGQLVAEHIQPPLASSIRADVDPSLDHICAKMLAKRIEDRYSSMAEVEEVLNGYLRGPSAVSGDSTGLTNEMGVMDLESPSSASNTKIAKVDKTQSVSTRIQPGDKTDFADDWAYAYEQLSSGGFEQYRGYVLAIRNCSVIAAAKTQAELRREVEQKSPYDFDNVVILWVDDDDVR
ncbi:MAG: serine/threonine protein kinase, partial [Planctomycetaceae bacterium]|nr:serine/threonine protein kinase [Planctomycetaceae bacterium]